MSIGDGEIARPGGLIFALMFLAVSIFLLTQLDAETKFSTKGNLFAEPAFWPAIGVIGMALFGALHAFGEFQRRSRNRSLRETRETSETRETGMWLRSLEYLIWFMGYVFAVPVIGYLPATLIFAVALACRAGYRSKRVLGAAALMGLGVVLVFKTMLSVKIPAGALYTYLPDALRSFAMINF